MTEQATETEVTPEEEPDTFPRAYVEELRQENAQRRTEAQQAGEQVTAMTEALRVAVLTQGSAGVLREALPWDDSYADPETGLPSVERVREAAEQVAQAKPWMSVPAAGALPLGFRGDAGEEPVSLAAMLRAGA